MGDGSDQKADKNSLAEDRTDLAEDRTIQATERTFAGWMRTAFAAIGVGIGFHVVFGEFEPPWLGKAISTLFIVLSITIAFTAERRASSTFARLSSHRIDRPRSPNVRWMTWSIIAGGLALIGGLWFLNDGSVGEGG